jgi:hypothetical protein
MAPPWPVTSLYTVNYCEENIYHLLETFNTAEIQEKWRVYAVFISNDTKTVILCQQQASTKAEVSYPVVWDYHVIALLQPRGVETDVTSWIYDFDTRLSRPCPFRGQCLKDAIRTKFASPVQIISTTLFVPT